MFGLVTKDNVPRDGGGDGLGERREGQYQAMAAKDYERFLRNIRILPF